MTTTLKVNNLKKFYTIKKLFKEPKQVKALNDVSFSLRKNKTLGVVGESGCGKSTLAKALLQLEAPTSGSIEINGINVNDVNKNKFRSTIQMIFQDPYNSLNPRKKAWEIIGGPLFVNSKLSSSEIYNKTLKIMEFVGLRKNLANRYPHMFSGGQRQRIGIARALILKPEILICDEPVSALDVSIQAQILNLLTQLQDNLKLSYLFISHDLSVVNHIADDIAVMYLGKIVEYGPREQIFQNPLHPYTKALINSSPIIGKNKEQSLIIKGELPSPIDPPSGCSFHKRCPMAIDQCSNSYPELKSYGEVTSSCHLIE